MQTAHYVDEYRFGQIRLEGDLEWSDLYEPKWADALSIVYRWFNSVKFPAVDFP